MTTHRPIRGRILEGLIAGVIAALAVTLMPKTTEGQAIFAEFCKKVEPRGGTLSTRDCSTKFTTAVTYIAIVVRTGRLNDDTDLAVELLDPDQASVWTHQLTISVQPGYYFPDWWMWRVLAVAGDEAALAAENVVLTAGMIRVEGKPVRERVGDWTLRIRVQRGTPRIFKFTLAAP